MLEINEEEGVPKIRGRQSSLEKGKAQATSTSIKVSSMGSNMRYGSIGGALSKRREPMDTNYTFDPALEVEKDERRRKLRQMNIKESLDKDAVARVWQDIARFWYQAGITFNAAKLKSFKIMLKSVGQFGSHLPPPSYHQLRVPLLKKEVTYTEENRST